MSGYKLEGRYENILDILGLIQEAPRTRHEIVELTELKLDTVNKHIGRLLHMGQIYVKDRVPYGPHSRTDVFAANTRPFEHLSRGGVLRGRNGSRVPTVDTSRD